MKHFHHLLKSLVASILQAQRRLLQHILFRLCCILFCLTAINNASMANDIVSAINKISTEDAFLQGQQHLQQANTTLAELSLTHIPANSPYAKLLAGNIATQNGDYDRAFSLLIPLQSNQTLIKSAAASLHASLSVAYEKQGDTINALDQRIRLESYLEDVTTTSINHDLIWQLLSGLSLQELIIMRGESANTTTQGWIDLSLAAKNQDIIASINTWASSYADHPAYDLAKKLLSQNAAQVSSGYPETLDKLPSNSSIAVIFLQESEPLSAKASAFIQGLQAAINKHAMLNSIKIYSAKNNNENFTQQYELAKSEGAEYFLTPKLIESVDALDTDASKTIRSILGQADLSTNDEAEAIATFAAHNAVQHISIITTNDSVAKKMLASFQSAWKRASGNEVSIITLAENTSSDNNDLFDLKEKISDQTHDMLVLALSAKNTRAIRPHIDISTPVFAFSNSNEITKNSESNTTLNALRFVDIPFLIDANNTKFAYYRKQAATLESPENNSYELWRAFALGVDYLHLLTSQTKSTPIDVIIDGLTGKISLDKSGNIKRQLSVARFTYEGIVLEQ